MILPENDPAFPSLFSESQAVVDWYVQQLPEPDAEHFKDYLSNPFNASKAQICAESCARVAAAAATFKTVCPPLLTVFEEACDRLSTDDVKILNMRHFFLEIARNGLIEAAPLDQSTISASIDLFREMLADAQSRS